MGGGLMAYSYSSRSLSRLNTCDPDLVLLFTEVLADSDCPSDITILEGHRGEARQDEMYRTGKSQLRWPRSKHNSTPSMAVDAAPYINGAVSWDWPDYWPLVGFVKAKWAELAAAGRVNGRLVCGADWKSFPDGPHYQIDR